MIRIKCPSCGSNLNAKDELVGQTRNCPKCSQPVYITADSALNPPIAKPSDQSQPKTEDGELPPIPHQVPERLNSEYCYLILNNSRLVASWKNNSQGWMLHTPNGSISAKRNRDQLPVEGDFKLIELKIEHTPEGRRLVGLSIFQLARRWALTVLDRGDDPILEKISGAGSLNREQKAVLRQAIRDQFMRPVWENAKAVLDFLGSTDYHSHSVG